MKMKVFASAFAAVLLSAPLLAQGAAAPAKPAAAAAATPNPVPDQEFRAVHLLNLTAAQETDLLASFAELNKMFMKLGCTTCNYHLWKVAGQQAGAYTYLWESSWPGKAVYEKLHNAPEWKAYSATPAGKKITEIQKGEVYNRFVEVKAAKK